MVQNLPSDKNFYDWYQKLIESGILSELVTSYYEPSNNVYSVTIEGKEYTYPIGTHPLLIHPHFNNNGDSISSELGGDIVSEDKEVIKRIAQQLANSKTGTSDVSEDEIEDYIWNDASYVVSDTNIDTNKDSLEFELSESTFYTTATSEYRLINELISAIMEEHFIGSTTVVEDNVLDKDFELRDRYFSSVVDRFKNPTNLSQGIGGTYVTIIQSEEEYYLLTGVRSDDVYIWPGRYTVFPAGLIQPTDISTGSMIRDHMLDEYTSEFYDISNPSPESTPVHSMEQLLDSDNATFDVTGCGVELVGGNFQIAGLLVIEYTDYVQFMQDNSASSFQHEDISLVELSSLDSIIESLVNPVNMTPTSAFSLLNGLKYLEENTDIDHPVDIDIDQYQPDRYHGFDWDI